MPRKRTALLELGAEHLREIHALFKVELEAATSGAADTYRAIDLALDSASIKRVENPTYLEQGSLVLRFLFRGEIIEVSHKATSWSQRDLKQMTIALSRGCIHTCQEGQRWELIQEAPLKAAEAQEQRKLQLQKELASLQPSLPQLEAPSEHS